MHSDARIERNVLNFESAMADIESKRQRQIDNHFAELERQVERREKLDYKTKESLHFLTRGLK